MNHEFRAYKAELSDKDRELLLYLKQELIYRSSSSELRLKQRKRNHATNDPMLETSILHGVKHCTIQKFESIINNGILCSEFFNQSGDGKTPFHADFFMSGEEGVRKFMDEINNAPTSMMDKNIYTTLKISDLIPAYGRRSKSIALIVNPTNNWRYMISTQKHKNNFGGKFIKEMPRELHVAILGGVPSTEIAAMIIGDNLNSNEFISLLAKKGVYIPIFDTQGKKIF